jgi:hypothetical protein
VNGVACSAAVAEKYGQPFAAVFHLDRLLPLSPGERPRLLARRNAALTAALKQWPGDPWSAGALAREAIADPATVPDRTHLVAPSPPWQSSPTMTPLIAFARPCARAVARSRPSPASGPERPRLETTSAHRRPK